MTLFLYHFDFILYYTCNLFFILIYKESLKIMVPPEDIDTQEKKTISFSCKTNRPNATVKWMKAGQEITFSKRIVYRVDKEKHTLTIKDCTLADEGEYTVVAGDDKATNKSDPMASLELPPSVCCTVPPRVELGVNMKSLIVVKAGDNVFLDAEVHGKPLPKVSWKKDGAPLVIAEGMKATQKKHVHLLELYSVTRKETGDYTVLAENLSGSKYQTSAPSFDLRGVYQKTVIAKAGDRVKVEIPVLGKPRPVVSWKKGDMALKETQRINTETTATSTILNISEIKRTDEGQYSMTGKNILGTLTETITVLVHDIPGPPTGPVKLEEHGESLDKANIDITPSFTTLQIDNVDRFDGGKYLVTVENASGSKTAFVNVRVLDTPGPPQNLIVKEVTRDSVSLVWDAP
uniref:Ig-like domain-containing protein n=1 Tax=Xiphophorus couchianus TaxID=32473 RepID=A0A3B5MIT0_9TELE